MRTAHYFLITPMFFILQSAPFNMIPGLPFSPNMALVLALHCSFLWGRSGGLIFGAGTGLLNDLLLCGAVGPSVLSWGLAGFCAGALREGYLSGELIVRAALVAAATIWDVSLQGAMARMAAQPAIGAAVLTALGPQTFVNVAFAMVAMPPLILADGFVERKSAEWVKRRKTRSFLQGMRTNNE